MTDATKFPRPNPTPKAVDSNSKAADPEIEKAKIGMRQAIIIAFITAVTGLIGGHAIPIEIDPITKQGLEDLSLEGKWKYMCVDGKGHYEHGGRFYIDKDRTGALELIGQRMFKDTLNLATNKWVAMRFPASQYLEWHSNWIFVNKGTQFNFEYEVEADRLVKGYCTGKIQKAKEGEKEKVISVSGHFYQLYPARTLSGTITFTRISDDEYSNPLWNREALANN